MRKGILRTGSIICILSTFFIVASELFSILFGLPMSYDAFVGNLEMAWEIILFVSFGIFGAILLILAIGFAYYYGYNGRERLKKFGLVIVSIGATIKIFSLLSLLNTTPTALRIYGNPPAPAIPGILASAEGGYMVYTMIGPIGSLLLYGVGFGLLTYFLKLGNRPKLVVGLSFLSAITGMSAIGLLLPTPIQWIFNPIHTACPILCSAVVIILGIMMLHGSRTELEMIGDRGLLVAIISGLLGFVSLVFYVVFLSGLIDFGRIDLLLGGWYAAGIFGVLYYIISLVAVLLAILGFFTFWERLTLGVSKIGSGIQFILSLAFVLLISSLGTLLGLLLVSMENEPWFWNIYGASIGNVLMQLAAFVQLLFTLGVAFSTVGILLLAFHFLAQNQRNVFTILASITGICLLGISGFLLTAPLSEFPGIYSILAIIFLSFFILANGIFLRKGAKPLKDTLGVDSISSQKEVI